MGETKGARHTDAAFSGVGLGLSVVNKAGPELLVSGLKMVPLLGNLFAAFATYHDITGKDGLVSYYNGCLAGTN